MAGKEIVDLRVVALPMDTPRLVGDDVVGPPVGLDGRRIRLVNDAIQILVETVEEKSQKLLGVVLRETRELRRLARVKGRDRRKALSDESCL